LFECVNSNDKTLEDIENLRKIFAKNSNFCVSDFQGLIAEDGQFYVMDPQDVDLHTGLTQKNYAYCLYGDQHPVDP
jgi:hypothetical protein